MALKRPDILEHTNSNFAIIEANNARGGHYQVATEANRNIIPLDKRALRMLVSYNDGVEEVTKKFVGATVADINWTNNSFWIDISSGGAGTLIFANGLFNDAGTVKLGTNPITEDTVLDINATRLMSIRTGEVTAVGATETWKVFQDTNAGTDEVTKPTLRRYLNETLLTSGEVGYDITEDGISFYNSYNQKPNKYAADYSIEMLLDIRSIPDVALVNTKISEVVFAVAAATSDVDSDLEVGLDKAIFFMPFNMELTEVFAGLGTQCTGSTFITDINQNGTTILSTKISIDASENTSLTAATPPVISVSTLTKGDKITIDFDQIGAVTAGKAHTIYLKGTIS